MNVCYNLQMQNITFGIIGAIVAGLLVYFLTRNKKDNSSITDDKSLGLLLQQMNELTRTVDAKLGESQKHVSESMRFQTTKTTRKNAGIT